MSKEGILSILSKKIERSDSTLRHSSLVIRHSISQSFFFDRTGRFFARRLGCNLTPAT
jgi:hypothetical protein